MLMKNIKQILTYILILIIFVFISFKINVDVMQILYQITWYNVTVLKITVEEKTLYIHDRLWHMAYVCAALHYGKWSVL